MISAALTASPLSACFLVMIVVMMVVAVMTMPSFDVLLLPTFGFVCAKSLELGQSSWHAWVGTHRKWSPTTEYSK